MILRRDRQRSPGSGEGMNAEMTSCEIRAARCTIEDRDAFLHMIREIARQYHINIICFNADMLAGRRHAESAVRHAVRSFEAGDHISNTLEMEALLYAAGSRQCSTAATFGFHEGENHLWICSYPSSATGWEALASVMHYVEGELFEGMDQKKQESLMQLFNITADELGSLESTDRISDLVLERVALLDVIR